MEIKSEPTNHLPLDYANLYPALSLNFFTNNKGNMGDIAEISRVGRGIGERCLVKVAFIFPLLGSLPKLRSGLALREEAHIISLLW